MDYTESVSKIAVVWSGIACGLRGHCVSGARSEFGLRTGRNTSVVRSCKSDNMGGEGEVGKIGVGAGASNTAPVALLHRMLRGEGSAAGQLMGVRRHYALRCWGWCRTPRQPEEGARRAYFQRRGGAQPCSIEAERSLRSSPAPSSAFAARSAAISTHPWPVL
jgi:hypothetical protein